MLKDRLISELCDFGVVYSLFERGGKGARRALIKASWEVEGAGGELVTRSCVFELNFERAKLVAMGRKGNQLPSENFPAARICAWARREWDEFLDT